MLREEGWDQARSLWERGETRTTSRIAYVEGRAGLARAQRERRLSGPALAGTKMELIARFESLAVVELSETLTVRAGDVAEHFGLTGGDAIHLASALELGDSELVVATWDGELRRAALDAGLAVTP